jgi:hypothetical protein
MGGGVSLPKEYESLAPEMKDEFQKKFAALKEEGKSDVDAVKHLMDNLIPKEHTSIPQQVSVKLVDLLTVVEEAIRNGKTPLIVDNSDDDKVNTFYTYRSAILLDGKKMGLDKSLHHRPVPEIMEEARGKLVASLKNGYPFVIAMTKSVTDFATTFNDYSLRLEPNHKCFPIEVFQQGILSALTFHTS